MGHDFLIMVQTISKRFKVLKRAIHVLHSRYVMHETVLLLDPRNVAQVDANDYFRIIVPFKSRIGVRPYARNDVCKTSDSKHL